MSVFNERLTYLMKQKGMSQKGVAIKAGVTESAMSYYSKGLRIPSGDVLLRIAKALDTTTDYLLGNSNQMEMCKELRYLQRNLGKLNMEQLKKAEEMLKIMFDDIFDDEEE